MTALLDGSPALVDRYRAVAAALSAIAGAPVEFRVAASTGHLGLVARLLCPAFGAAVLGHQLDLRHGRWQAVVGGVLPLWFPAGALSPGVSAESVVAGPILELTKRTALYSVSPKVLWGNVASALNGALNSVVAHRPDLADRARDVAAGVLRTPALAGASTNAPGPAFRRNSCCLIYRIALPRGRNAGEGGNAGTNAVRTAGAESFCGDCILR